MIFERRTAKEDTKFTTYYLVYCSQISILRDIYYTKYVGSHFISSRVMKANVCNLSDQCLRCSHEGLSVSFDRPKQND